MKTKIQGNMIFKSLPIRVLAIISGVLIIYYFGYEFGKFLYHFTH